MSFKKTLIFLIILIFLGAYYYIYEVKISEKREEAAREHQKLFPVTIDQIKEFSLTKNGSFNLVAQRIDGNWRIIQPVETAGDQVAINRFLDELVKAEVNRVIEDEPQDLSPYGLDKPVIKVAFPTGEANNSLSLGNRNVTESFVYGQKEGEKKILLLHETLRSELDKSLYDLRDKSLVNFSPSEVDTLQIIRGHLDIKIKQDSSSEWSILQPGSYKADAGSIVAILIKLRNEKIKEFVSEKPDDLSPYGLINPVYRISISLKENKGHRTLLLGSEKTGSDKPAGDVGNYAQEKGVLFAKIEGEPAVFLINSDVATELPKKVDDLRYQAEPGKVVER